MKEATGELNMTVVTLIAVAAVAGLFYFFLWPMVQRMVANQTCSTYGKDWTAEYVTEEDIGTQAKIKIWMCCPVTSSTSGGKTTTAVDKTRCIKIDDKKSSGGTSS